MAQCTPKSFDLTGKVALITGASYGIGMAIAKAMAANGATIVFNDIKQELVDKGLASYAEAGIKAHGYVCDVTDEDAVNAMVAKITEEVGHINILVNNAGIIKRCDAIDVTPENWDAVDFLNEKMVFFLSQAVAKQWVADKKGGKIINIASVGGLKGTSALSLYGASKAGVINLTKTMALEWSRYGIQTNAVCPGYVVTEINKAEFENEVSKLNNNIVSLEKDIELKESELKSLNNVISSKDLEIKTLIKENKQSKKLK